MTPTVPHTPLPPVAYRGELWHGTANPRELLAGPVRCGGEYDDGGSECRLGLYLTSSRDEIFDYACTPARFTVTFQRALALKLEVFDVPADPSVQVLASVGVDLHAIAEHTPHVKPGELLADLGYDGVLIDWSDGRTWAVPLDPQTAELSQPPDCRLHDVDSELAGLWNGEDRDALSRALDIRQALLEDPAFSPDGGWDAWRMRWRREQP